MIKPFPVKMSLAIALASSLLLSCCASPKTVLSTPSSSISASAKVVSSDQKEIAAVEAQYWDGIYSLPAKSAKAGISLISKIGKANQANKLKTDADFDAYSDELVKEVPPLALIDTSAWKGKARVEILGAAFELGQTGSAEPIKLTVSPTDVLVKGSAATFSKSDVTLTIGGKTVKADSSTDTSPEVFFVKINNKWLLSGSNFTGIVSLKN